MDTIVWQYILTLGTYLAPGSTDMSMETHAGTMIVPADKGRSFIYVQLRETLAQQYPHLANAVVIHSDIQPDMPPLRG